MHFKWQTQSSASTPAAQEFFYSKPSVCVNFGSFITLTKRQNPKKKAHLELPAEAEADPDDQAAKRDVDSD
jgi:hypothetical protein